MNYVKSVCIRSYSGPHSDSISPYSVPMRENADQNNPKYGHFLRSDAPHYFSRFQNAGKHLSKKSVTS